MEVRESRSIFVPNAGGQAEFMSDYSSRFCALAGGWYAGKTWAGARKHAAIHVRNAIDDDGRPSYVRSLVIAQNYSLARQVNIPELQGAFDEMGLVWRFVPDPKRYCFEFPDLGTRDRPSEMLVRSAEAPETINAFTVGSAWGDEVPRWPQSDDNPKADALLQAKGRLRDPRARILQFNMTFTHEGDGTRVYRDFEEKPLPDHKLYRAGTIENPAAMVFAETMKGQLTPEMASQYLEGIAANFRGGKIYGAFGPDNISDSLVLDRSLPVCLALDHNIAPGAHGIVGQFFPDRQAVTAVHELHAKNMSTLQLLGAFRSLVASLGWVTEVHVFGDPAGSARFEATGESTWDLVRQWFRQHMPEMPIRYRYKAGHSPVADRVNATNAALRNVKGDVRALIHPRCERLISDMRSLKWDGNEIDKKDRKLSHASDAWGYEIEVLMPLRKFELSTWSTAAQSAY